MWRNLIRNILFAFILIGLALIGVKQLNSNDFNNPSASKPSKEFNQNLVSSRMTYGRFLEYLDLALLLF